MGPHNRVKSKMTSCHRAWNINLDTTSLTINNLHSFFQSTYLFIIYLFIYLLVYFYLIIIVSIWLYYCRLSIFGIKLYFSCMVTWSHLKFKSLLATNWRGHRQNKSWSRIYYVTMYQRKIRTKLFPIQDAVQ